MRARTTTSPELRSALERLFSLQTFGIKLGLEPVSLLLAEFGDPQHAFASIHVAGTNGKGSVCAMLASILRAAGLRVGLYTSPHLVDFSERIRVDGVPIDEERLALYAREMLPAIERIGCTFFEGTTAMGLRYFAEERVDIAIVETGMGGRLDATNVLRPLVSAITSISLDHTKHLGETLEAIAGEKAGIIKPGVPAVVGHVTRRLREVFEVRAEDVGAPLAFVDDTVHAIYRSIDYTRTVGSFIVGRGDDARELTDVEIGLVGRHQIENTRVVLGVVDALAERLAIDEATLRAGLRDVRANTGIQGRFERVSTTPPMIVDVAHNPDGARVLADTLSLISGGARNTRLVYGSVEDKDVVEILRILAPVATHLHAVRADSPRSLAAAEVLQGALDAGIDATLAGSVRAGVDGAIASLRDGEVIVVCGSFFVVGEALVEIEALSKRNDTDEDDHFDEGESIAQLPDETDGIVGEERDESYAASIESARRLTVKEWSETEQPRERLMALGAGALSDAELLAIVMRTGTKQLDVLTMCRRLLAHFNTDPHNEGALYRLAQRDFKELQAIPGIGPTKAVTLAAAFELGRRATAINFSKRPRISGPRDVAAMFIPELRHIQKEQFHVVILNTANQVVRRVLVSEGNLNSSIVHPREVFRHAIVENAAAIIGLHNHPSGNPTPSKEDIAITRQLVEAGRIIGIPLHDHLIIAGEEFVSLAEKGYV
ncbi:MAG TPA: DNA repair protein RadC [Candidatus Kapabacteria bacterium]|nr:DNA repair protein RadC [Candidatus Kapabacteria bacterium]